MRSGREQEERSRRRGDEERRRGEETRRGEEKRGEEEEEEEEEEATDIKSNNPHLAGGEKGRCPFEASASCLNSVLGFVLTWR